MSGIGTVAKDSEEEPIYYCFMIFYQCQNDNGSYGVDCVVVWNAEIHLKVSIYTNTLNITHGINGSIVIQSIMMKYKCNDYVLGPTMPLEFESDTIRIDIPNEGICVEGWKIIPLTPPIVSICFM